MLLLWRVRFRLSRNSTTLINIDAFLPSTCRPTASSYSTLEQLRDAINDLYVELTGEIQNSSDVAEQNRTSNERAAMRSSSEQK